MTPRDQKVTRRQSPRALAAQVFHGSVPIGCCEVASADPSQLFPEERAAIGRAIIPRQQEFTAGRIAAREAMGSDILIPMATDRAPIWPAGFAGSITHAGGWALAVAGHHDRLLGIDLELDDALPHEVFDTVLSQSERAWLREQPEPEVWARVIFSAKECAYKAQYPRTLQLFGFEVFEVSINPAAGEFSARFQRDIAPFRAGDALNGRFSRGDGFILCGIVA